MANSSCWFGWSEMSTELLPSTQQTPPTVCFHQSIHINQTSHFIFNVILLELHQVQSRLKRLWFLKSYWLMALAAKWSTMPLLSKAISFHSRINPNAQDYFIHFFCTKLQNILYMWHYFIKIIFFPTFNFSYLAYLTFEW